MAERRRRTRLRLTLPGLLVLSLLAGCMGIPMDGPVRSGDIVDDQALPDFEVLPDGPTPGSDPPTLLSDFMQAVQSPANNYAIAKQFMTPALAASWDPNAQTTIRLGGSEIIPKGEAELEYAFTSGAFVDDLGRYAQTPPSQQRLGYSFEQVDGQWRISAAPAGIVLTENSFDVVFRSESLYFFDPGYSYLVPDVRWVPVRPTTNDRVVRLLLEGPSAWLAPAVVSEFPEGTTLEETPGVTVTGNTATVLLSADAAQASDVQLTRIRQQLAATLGVGAVVLSVGGGVGIPGLASTATIDPAVEGPVLIGTGDAFGYPGADDEVVPLPTLSDRIVAAAADAATVLGQRVAAFRSAGRVLVTAVGSDAVVEVDQRPGLLPPALDPYGFVWTIPADSAAGVAAFALDGTGGVLVNGLPPDSKVTAMAVSRDGTRLLLATVNAVGIPQLAVHGIIRGADNVPVAVGGGLALPTAGAALDVAWVDESTVVVLSGAGEGTSATLIVVGEPSAPLGQVPGAVQVVGGNDGTQGIRVLDTGGTVQQLRGRTWQSTGLDALFLGVQQGRER